MKLLKHVLLIGTICTSLSFVHAQESPPIKQRGNSTFQAVDDYLIAVKRLGIPTGTQDDLNAVVAAPNTAKIMYRTDIKTLRIYDPVTGLWGNAVPGIDTTNLVHKTGNETITGNKVFNGEQVDFLGNNPPRFYSGINVPYGNGINFKSADNKSFSLHSPGNGSLLWLDIDGTVFSFEKNGRLGTNNDNKHFLKEGEAILASPENLQEANVGVTGNGTFGTILTKSYSVRLNDDGTGYIGQVSFGPYGTLGAYNINSVGGYTQAGGAGLWMLHANGDYAGSPWRFSLDGTDRFSVGTKGIILPLVPDSSTTSYSLLTRDKSTGEVKQIGQDDLNFIKSSPEVPQTADINLNGSVFLRNTTGININRGSNANAVNIWNGADDNTLISATVIGTQIGDGTVAGRLYKDRLIFAQNQKGLFTLAITPPSDGISANRALSAPDQSGEIALVPVGEFTDNADALAGGLKVGQLYRTGDIVKVVH